MLVGPTGLHHQDQKLIFKDKGRASKSISEISLEVDRLAGQVSALESIISKGKNIAEQDVLVLIEQLMNQLLKLDGIMGDGEGDVQWLLLVAVLSDGNGGALDSRVTAVKRLADREARRFALLQALAASALPPWLLPLNVINKIKVCQLTPKDLIRLLASAAAFECD
ncbi:BAG family molecular chaperone regulator 1 [Pyrus ussuriensis x Pyrus communis]|uniref:BAG family molecular chaperone regulator 1 n=1 Tax=Pyrus ussuriensis x Pyrus communis TaxID=2448454 RepID=A0A5N5I7C0_9ROSA|nr:BAG family molecular chaperone regulator 1 [Pyrus ussuriensis x Pyrus communis]